MSEKPKPTKEARKLWNFLHRVESDARGKETPEKTEGNRQAVERIRDEMRYLWDMSEDENEF